MVYVSWLTVITLLLFSSLGLVVPNASNGCLFVLFLLGLTSFASKERRTEIAAIGKKNWPIFLAMLLPLFAVLLHQLTWQDGMHASEYDRPFRLALFFFVFSALYFLSLKHLKWIQWAWIVCAFLGYIKAWSVTDGGSIPNTGAVGFTAGIVFSNIALLIGIWLLLTFDWSKTTFFKCLKIAAIFAAFGVTFLIKTRGTWLALPFFAIFFAFHFYCLNVWKKIGILLLPIILIGASVVGSSSVRERIWAMHDDIVAYQTKSNVDTSLGQRLEIWKGSLFIFKEHPYTGVGRANFKAQLRMLADDKRISASVVELPHSHNGLFFSLALWGIAGGISWLLVYLIPGIYFYKGLSDSDQQTRVYSAMGIIQIIGFVIFDLSDVMFFWVVLNGFYAINTALFFACIKKRQNERDLSNAVVQVV